MFQAGLCRTGIAYENITVKRFNPRGGISAELAVVRDHQRNVFADVYLSDVVVQNSPQDKPATIIKPHDGYGAVSRNPRTNGNAVVANEVNSRQFHRLPDWANGIQCHRCRASWRCVECWHDMVSFGYLRRGRAVSVATFRAWFRKWLPSPLAGDCCRRGRIADWSDSPPPEVRPGRLCGMIGNTARPTWLSTCGIVHRASA